MAWYKPIIDGVVGELQEIFSGQADELKDTLDAYIEEDRLRQEAIVEKLDKIWESIGDVNENVLKIWAQQEVTKIDAVAKMITGEDIENTIQKTTELFLSQYQEGTSDPQ